MKSAPTYAEIQQWIRDQYGYTVKTCWIADVKRSLGYPMWRSWNSNGGRPANPCPGAKRAAIKAAIELLR